MTAAFASRSPAWRPRAASSSRRSRRRAPVRAWSRCSAAATPRASRSWRSVRCRSVTEVGARVGKRRSDDRADGGLETLDRVFDRLDAAPAGLHDVALPGAQLPSGLPEPLIELYARCDGARLFLDSIELAPSAEVTAEGDRWRFGTLEDEDLEIDRRGRIWRTDASLDDRVCEGTRLERWLAGVVDAVAMLYDDEGEFRDGCFDEDGELVAEVGERQLRAMLKRDPGAPGPRWRLAHALLSQDRMPEARGELGATVGHRPGF